MGKQELVASDDSIPSTSQLQKANSVTLYESNNTPVKFSSLLESKKTVILIMTRHLHCGNCAQYLMALSEDPNIGHLLKSEGDDKAEVIVIGPGQHQGIERYREFAGGIKCKVLADPKKELYKALGVTKRSLELGNTVSLT